MTPEEIAAALDCDDLKVGQSRKVHAPYRDDPNPSLNVTRKERTFLFHDFGFTETSALEALRDHFAGQSVNGSPKVGVTSGATDVPAGLSPLDWFAESTGVPRDVWERLGCDEDARHVIFEFRGVDARKLRKKGTRDFEWRGKAAPPLWPIPEETLPTKVALTESESDCGTLRHCGIHAFAGTKGAKGTGEGGLNADVLRELKRRGVAEVVVYPDADAPGREFCDSVITHAASAGLACRYVDLAPYCDVTRGDKDVNHLYQHLGERDFLRISEEATIDVEQRPYADSFGEVLGWADEDEEWLVEGLIARGTKTLVSAPAKNLKTYLVLHLIACCSTCAPLLNVAHYCIPEPLRVLLVEEEGSRQMAGRRVRRVFRGLGRQAREEPEFRFRRGFNLLDRAQVTDLIAHAKVAEIDLLILDPLQRITPGVDENSNSDMRRVWDAVNRILLELPHVAVVVVAHTRKGDSLTPEATRGAGITLGEYDLGVFLQKQDDFTRTDSTYQGTLALTLDGRELPHEYTKAGGALEVEYAFDYASDTFTMQATGETVVTIRATPKMQGRANETLVFEAVRAICETTSHGATKEDVQRVTDLAPRTVEKHLARLVDGRRLTRTEVAKEKGGVKAVWEVRDAS